MKKFTCIILFVGLFVGCEESDIMEDVTPGPNFENAVKSGPMIVVPDDYPTIQQAVNAAAGGETILIKQGTYTELVFIINKNDLTLMGEGALIKPPASAADPDMNIYIEDCSNIDIMNLDFDGRNANGDYPVYCAIGYTFSSGEASNNKIKGYGLGIACYNVTLPDPAEELDLKFSNNKISEVSGCGINFIGNFNVEVDHNLIECPDKFFENWWWWFGINMEGGTGTISKNNIKVKNGTYTPETAVGVKLMMRNPAPHNHGMAPLHDVDVEKCIIRGTDIGIMVNSYDPLPEGEEWCVHGVSLRYNQFIQVEQEYFINNECEEIEIIPLP